VFQSLSLIFARSVYVFDKDTLGLLFNYCHDVHVLYVVSFSAGACGATWVHGGAE